MTTSFDSPEPEPINQATVSMAAEIGEFLMSNQVRVVNHSGAIYGIGDDKQIEETNKQVNSIFSTLAKEDIILVRAAGNSSQYEEEIEKFERSPKFRISPEASTKDKQIAVRRRRSAEAVISGSPAIVVGALGRNGRLSETMSMEAMDIVAPGQNPSHSEKYGPIDSLDKTSGASPLVHGAVTTLLTLLPTLKLQDIEELLRQTGIPSQASPPMLNSYKLFRVAQRIRSQCPRAHLECVRQVMQKPQTYDFRDESRQYLAKVAGPSGTRCLNREEFNNLRKAYLLDPSAEIYAKWKSFPNPLWVEYPIHPNFEYPSQGLPRKQLSTDN